jgi:hypothetical protein
LEKKQIKRLGGKTAAKPFNFAVKNSIIQKLIILRFCFLLPLPRRAYVVLRFADYEKAQKN